MKINVDQKYKKFFNKTGTYIKEYRLFIKKGGTAEEASIEETDIPIVVDTDDIYYLLKDYTHSQRIMEVYKHDIYGLGRCMINKAYTVERGGIYDYKEGLDVCLYSTTSIKSSRRKIIKCLKKFIEDNRWKIDIDVKVIEDIMEGRNS